MKLFATTTIALTMLASTAFAFQDVEPEDFPFLAKMVARKGLKKGSFDRPVAVHSPRSLEPFVKTAGSDGGEMPTEVLLTGAAGELDQDCIEIMSAALMDAYNEAHPGEELPTLTSAITDKVIYEEVLQDEEFGEQQQRLAAAAASTDSTRISNVADGTGSRRLQRKYGNFDIGAWIRSMSHCVWCWTDNRDEYDDMWEPPRTRAKRPRAGSLGDEETNSFYQFEGLFYHKLKASSCDAFATITDAQVIFFNDHRGGE